MTTTPKASKSPARPPALQQIAADPDLVDRIFEYILADSELGAAVAKMAQGAEKIEDLKHSVRSEFRGEECYIPATSPTERQRKVSRVLALFNGRNATEVARQLGISRGSVYRYIKQSGGQR